MWQQIGKIKMEKRPRTSPYEIEKIWINITKTVAPIEKETLKRIILGSVRIRQLRKESSSHNLYSVVRVVWVFLF